jgi:hypothetical protein
MLTRFGCSALRLARAFEPEVRGDREDHHHRCADEDGVLREGRNRSLLRSRRRLARARVARALVVLVVLVVSALLRSILHWRSGTALRELLCREPMHFGSAHALALILALAAGGAFGHGLNP